MAREELSGFIVGFFLIYWN